MDKMQAMASKMWMPFIVMGFLIVLISFAIGLVNSGIATDYYSASKAAREAATAGTDLASAKATIESTKIWLPAFKFLGIGMLLSGVTFLLVTIIGSLSSGGKQVQKALGGEVMVPKTPKKAKMMVMFMIMGLMILIATLVIGIITANTSSSYWDHSIATELNTAAEGSPLLSDLSSINSTKLWIEPLKFVGMASLLTGIGFALATIVGALKWQTNRLLNLMP